MVTRTLATAGPLCEAAPMSLARLLCATVALGVCLLLYGSATGHPTIALIAKSVASLSFVALAFHLGAAQGGPYGRRVLLGLALGCGGDIALQIPGDAPFLIGLVLFLCAHLLYIAAFATQAPPRSWFAKSALAVLAASSGAVVWLWPHLDRQPAMRVPVLLYVCAISVMVMSALAASRAQPRGAPRRLLIPLGAILFYLSDLTVAQNRFVEPLLLASALGLPAYYLAQVLLAFSASPARRP